MIKPGQKIHASVSFIRDYKPKARFSPGVEGWRSILEKGRLDDVSWAKPIEDLLELDLFVYSNVKRIIEDATLDELVLISLTRRFITWCCDSLLLTQVHFRKLKGGVQ